MEIDADDPITVVQFETDCCCSTSQKKLEKALLKIEGVSEVYIDQEKNLVSIKGKTDPFILIKTLFRMGHDAQLYYYEKEPRTSRNHPNRDNVKEKKKDKEPSSSSDGEEDRRGFCSKGSGNLQEEKENKARNHDKKHGTRDKVPKEGFDEHLCRDQYCRTHRRDQYFKGKSMPISGQQYSKYHSNGNSKIEENEEHYPSRRWQGKEPEVPPRENNHWSTTSQAPYGPARPMPWMGYHKYNYFSDENPEGCMIM